MTKTPKLPGSENLTSEQQQDICDEFVAKAVQWCKASNIPVEMIERQLLATAAFSMTNRKGVEATKKWLRTAAEKVALHEPPAGNA